MNPWYTKSNVFCCQTFAKCCVKFRLKSAMKYQWFPISKNGNLHQSGFTATILDRESHQDANMIESSNCPQVNI